MGELISRAAAIEAIVNKTPFERVDDIKSICNKSREIANGWLGGVLAAIKAAEKVKAVDAVPVVHAKWQGVSPFVDSEECSNCRYCIPSEELETPYCPWCGAKMDGERRDNDAPD